MRSYIASVSRDGASLWLRVDMGTASDIWRVPLGGAVEKAVPVLVTPADERDAMSSPDGRWLAYRTDASGRCEVVLAPMATPGNAVQVSIDGGRPLNWSRDGRRLFYRQGDEVWEVTIGPGGALRASARRIFTVAPWLSFVEVAPDGERLFTVRGGLIYSDLIVRQGALK